MTDMALTTPRTQAQPTRLRRFLRWLAGDLRAALALLVLLVLVVVAIGAPWIAPYSPTAQDINNMLASPGAGHLLGTDDLGRDIFSRLIYGAPATVYASVLAVSVAVAIGLPVGLVAGFFGGWTDAVLMRFADVALGIPFLPFVILLAGFLGPATSNVIIGIAALLWPNTARVIRSQVLTVRERAFVEAARVTGASPWRILFVHVAPNILPLTFLYGSIAVGWAILTEAAVSFLGFGPSDVVSWGYMLQDAYGGQALSRGSYNWFVPPGLCIVLVVVAGFFISRGYEEILFPKLKD